MDTRSLTHGLFKKSDGKIRHLLIPTKIGDYIIFLIILGVIFSLLAIRGNYILAPPYAVSAYLVVFERGTKYASRRSLAASYILVILSSDILHIFVGANLSGILFNVILISAFITFTDLSHPPVIALVVFSYIAGNSLDFTVSSLLSLVVLLMGSHLIEKYESVRVGGQSSPSIFQ